MELQVIDAQGKSASTRIGVGRIRSRIQRALVQVVVAYRAKRQPCAEDACQFATRPKKPWKQRGTGNARAGMTSSPIWRGGGRAFRTSRTRISRTRSIADVSRRYCCDLLATGSRRPSACRRVVRS